jgi:hypothetical protein
MAQRFACIATSRRRRALAASLSSHAVRTRRASASLRRSTGAWHDLGEPNTSLDLTDRRDAPRAPERTPLPAIISRR